MKRFYIWGISLFFIFGCAEVAPYERGYTNDPAMANQKDPCDNYRRQIKVYREGAAGATGSKSGGGCGCY